MDDAVNRFVRYQFPVILWGIIIFIASSIPNLAQPMPFFPHIDKVAHFFEYGILAYLMSRAIHYSSMHPGLIWSLVLSLVFCAVFGAGDEIHQLFIPGRIESISDFAADLAGIFCALTVFYIRHGRRNPVSSKNR